MCVVQSEVVVFGRVCRSCEEGDGPVGEIYLQGDLQLSGGASGSTATTLHMKSLPVRVILLYSGIVTIIMKA